MKVSFIGLLTFLTIQPVIPQPVAVSDPYDLAVYRELNNKETGMIEFKDDDQVLALKLIQLEVINRSRKKYRVPALRLDILASRVANSISREAAENGFVSHWNMAGEKPYHRYAFAGGYDHISENAFGEWTTGSYERSQSDISSMMESGHHSFMSERAPADGHKQNVIDKTHNFVGIGYCLTDKQFRYYEEYIDRYLFFEKIPSRLKVNESGSITFGIEGNSFPYYLIIYREKIPQPMPVSRLENTGSYSDFSNEEYLQLPAWEIAKYKSKNSYRVPLKFGKEGLYYIHIYIDKKEIKNPSALNTRGKTEGCGIVIRVEK